MGEWHEMTIEFQAWLLRAFDLLLSGMHLEYNENKGKDDEATE